MSIAPSSLTHKHRRLSRVVIRHTRAQVHMHASLQRLKTTLHERLGAPDHSGVCLGTRRRRRLGLGVVHSRHVAAARARLRARLGARLRLR
eukprot:6198102-Pleurochrysis_carterae.AAC.1